MKNFIIFILIVAGLFIVVKLSIPKPDQTIPEATNQPQDTTPVATTTPESVVGSEVGQETKFSPSNIKISFTGYGPGKQHDGTISVKESTLSRIGATFKGGVVIDMNSIVSSPDMLVKDLKSSKFFDVEKYPTSNFTITEATDAQVKGNLTIKGVTKQVTLPITFDSATSAFSSTVRINMELFGIKQTFADKEFVLKISIK